MKDLLRKIARSNRYQLLYNRSKDIGSISLFNNKSELSKIQIRFLYYLELYSGLYSNLATKEPLISEDVIKDDIRVDAYFVYKRRTKHLKETTNKNKSDKVVDNMNGRKSLIFKRKN